MFREYLHRIHQALVRGRKPRSRRVPRNGRPATARLAVDGLEDRTLLSTLTLGGGALVYTPSTSAGNILSIYDNATTHRYTFVDSNEYITLVGSFISPAGGGTHTVSFGDGNISSIVVNTGNQDFTVEINQTLASAPVTVNLGNGNDNVAVSPATANLNGIQGAITVHTGGGTDTLTVDDEFNTDAQTY